MGHVAVKNRLISLVVVKQLHQPFLALRTENRIGQSGVTQFHIKQTNVGNLKGGVVQIDGISNLERDAGGWVAWLCLECSVLFIRSFGFLHLHIHPYCGNRLRMEYRFVLGQNKADVLELNHTGVEINTVYEVGLSVVGKGSFAGNQVFFCEHTLGIVHHLLNEWVCIQSVRINQLSVHNAAFGKSFADGNRVYIIQAVIFFRRIELICLDELGNSPLHLRPGHYMVNVRTGQGDVQRLTRIGAVFTSQPCGGVSFTGMVLHIAHYSPLALRASIPTSQCLIDILLRQLCTHLLRILCYG